MTNRFALDNRSNELLETINDITHRHPATIGEACQLEVTLLALSDQLEKHEDELVGCPYPCQGCHAMGDYMNWMDDGPFIYCDDVESAMPLAHIDWWCYGATCDFPNPEFTNDTINKETTMNNRTLDDTCKWATDDGACRINGNPAYEEFTECPCVNKDTTNEETTTMTTECSFICEGCNCMVEYIDLKDDGQFIYCGEVDSSILLNHIDWCYGATCDYPKFHECDVERITLGLELGDLDDHLLF